MNIVIWRESDTQRRFIVCEIGKHTVRIPAGHFPPACPGDREAADVIEATQQTVAPPPIALKRLVHKRGCHKYTESKSNQIK